MGRSQQRSGRWRVRSACLTAIRSAASICACVWCVYVRRRGVRCLCVGGGGVDSMRKRVGASCGLGSGASCAARARGQVVTEGAGAGASCDGGCGCGVAERAAPGHRAHHRGRARRGTSRLPLSALLSAMCCCPLSLSLAPSLPLVLTPQHPLSLTRHSLALSLTHSLSLILA
eukprot:981550-Rhodomonas_salina.1